METLLNKPDEQTPNRTPIGMIHELAKELLKNFPNLPPEVLAKIRQIKGLSRD